jgi:hypothetical protein
MMRLDPSPTTTNVTTASPSKAVKPAVSATQSGQEQSDDPTFELYEQVLPLSVRRGFRSPFATMYSFTHLATHLLHYLLQFLIFIARKQYQEALSIAQQSKHYWSANLLIRFARTLLFADLWPSSSFVACFEKKTNNNSPPDRPT